MNWRMAHRVAAIAASNLRRTLDLPEDTYVDAMTALRRCGLTVMAQPMPSLFGAYVPAGPGRHGGILLNSRARDEATFRHTGAHELGHFALKHGKCLSEDLDDFTLDRSRRWSDEEKQAEAFAAWLLMPIRAVKATLTRLGLDVPREAMDAYQLSLHLGTSYHGTIRHLKHLGMVAAGVADGWRAIPPARLRARACGRRHDVPARVWDLSALTEGSRLPVQVGDRLIVRAPWLGDDPTVSGPDTVVVRTDAAAVAVGDGVELDVVGHVDVDTMLTLTSRSDTQSWSVTLMATPRDHQGLIAGPAALRASTSGVRR